MQKSIYILFLTASIIIAQNPTTENIVGSYKLPSNDPQGGQSVLIFENNTFATFFFGGALKGTWKIEGNQVAFKTVANPAFYLYGRKLNSLKDSTHLNFEGQLTYFVNLNLKVGATMQPLFNENANCLSFPYLFKTTDILTDMAFARPDYRNDSGFFNIHTFTVPVNYNDLIIIGLPEEYTTESEFAATYKDGNLYFGNNGKAASKRPVLIEDSKEDKAYLDEFMNKELIPELLTYGNEFFPYCDDPSKEQLTPYTRIAPIKIVKDKVIIEENNLFTANCQD